MAISEGLIRLKFAVLRADGHIFLARAIIIDWIKASHQPT